MTLFPALRRRPSGRTATLAIQALEDRTTPATAAYSALSQTLTIVAAPGDRLVVAPVTNDPAGFLKITETQGAVTTVFDSSTAHQAVRNLVVKFDAVGSGGLTVNADARLGGNLTVLGAHLTQSLDLLGTVGGNLTYKAGAGAAFDDLDIESTAQVGGNMNLALGAGENTVRLKGGTVRGNLVVAGGAGVDRVEVNASDDINVGGSARVVLGGGNNTLVGINAHLIRVGTNFIYSGGGGNDTFDLDGSGSTLQAGQDVRLTLGNSGAFDSNLVTFEGLNVGRNVYFTGGAGDDTVTISGSLFAGGSVFMAPGNGTNSFDSNLLGNGINSIGGGFNYTGGTGADAVSLDGTSVGRNVTVSLGAGSGQAFDAGTKSPGGVTVFGTLKVTGGSGADGISLHRVYVGNALVLATGGGADAVGMEDLSVAGATQIDLGAGNDFVMMVTSAADSGGLLDKASSFGGTFTVTAGAGNDTVNLGADLTPDATTFAHFGSHVVLVGGAGADTLINTAENVFDAGGSNPAFETLNGPPL